MHKYLSVESTVGRTGLDLYELGGWRNNLPLTKCTNVTTTVPWA